MASEPLAKVRSIAQNAVDEDWHDRDTGVGKVGIFRGCEGCRNGFEKLAKPPRSGWSFRVCLCVRVRLWEELIAPRFGLRKFAGASKSDFLSKNCAAIERAAAGQSLLITGETGQGKTHLAAAVMREWFRKNREWSVINDWLLGICHDCGGSGELENGGECYCDGRGVNGPAHAVTSLNLKRTGINYSICQSINTRIRKSWNRNNSETEEQVTDPLKAAKLLVLDEFGPGLDNEHMNEKWFDIIDHRYREELQTIVVTNLSVDQLQSAEARIFSRLVEMIGGQPEDKSKSNLLVLKGVDRRFA